MTDTEGIIPHEAEFLLYQTEDGRARVDREWRPRHGHVHSNDVLHCGSEDAQSSEYRDRPPSALRGHSLNQVRSARPHRPSGSRGPGTVRDTARNERSGFDAVR